jgi:hypothetical protein
MKTVKTKDGWYILVSINDGELLIYRSTPQQQKDNKLALVP